VVLWSPFPPERFAAGDRRPRDFAIGLRAAGLSTVIFAPEGVSPRVSVTLNDPPVDHLGGNSFNRRSGISRLAYWWCVYRRCSQSRGAMLLFYNPPMLGALCAFLLRCLGHLVVVEICDRNSLSESKGPFRRALHWLTEYTAVHSCNACIVICSELASWVRRIAPGKRVAVVPVMVDLAMFRFESAQPREAKDRLSIATDSPIVVYAGSFHQEEGVAQLIDAFAQIASHHPRVRLVLAGRHMATGQQLEGLHRCIERGAVESSVVLPGFLETSDLASLLLAADVLALPQLDVPLNRSALPTKMAEYAAAGKAILATNVGDISNYLVHGDSAFIVQDVSARGLALGLEALLSDPNLRLRLGTGARKVGLLMTPEQSVRRILNELSGE